jgi:hypothetical protein
MMKIKNFQKKNWPNNILRNQENFYIDAILLCMALGLRKGLILYWIVIRQINLFY